MHVAFAAVAVAHAQGAVIGDAARGRRPCAIALVHAQRVASQRIQARVTRQERRKAFGIELPPWEDGVRAVVSELASATGRLNP